jgi:hypothetical protein
MPVELLPGSHRCADYIKTQTTEFLFYLKHLELLAAVVQIGDERLKAFTQMKNDVVPSIAAAEAIPHAGKTEIAPHVEPSWPSFKDGQFFLW